jgi:hypothetical protein
MAALSSALNGGWEDVGSIPDQLQHRYSISQRSRLHHIPMLIINHGSSLPMLHTAIGLAGYHVI